MYIKQIIVISRPTTLRNSNLIYSYIVKTDLDLTQIVVKTQSFKSELQLIQLQFLNTSDKI